MAGGKIGLNPVNFLGPSQQVTAGGRSSKSRLQQNSVLMALRAKEN